MIKLGIVGLGLIGSSILKTLANNGEYEIYCYSNSNYKNALKYCNCASNNLEIVKECNIVFVCSKVDETLNILNILNRIQLIKFIRTEVILLLQILVIRKMLIKCIIIHLLLQEIM
jgi:prephenate dehydrogenase